MRRRMRQVFVVAAVIVLAGTVVVVAALLRLEDGRQSLVGRFVPAGLEASQLAQSLVEQQTGVRGYILTGDDLFLGPYRQGREDEGDSAARLRMLLVDEPELVSALDDVRTAGRVWRSNFAQPAIQSVRNDRAITQVVDRTGQFLFDQVRTALDLLIEQLNDDATQASQRLTDSLRLVATLLAGALAAVVLVGIGIWVSLRRWVLWPLDDLAEQTRDVAAGQFDQEVAAGGPAEIVDLGDDIDAMRRRVVTDYDEAVRSREEIRTQAGQLERQAADLRRSNEELEQFAYVASHDLQEPLRKIASFCQLLQRRYSGRLDERADQYLDFAVDGAKRMQQLINDLLAFSRVGRTSDGLAVVDCNEAVRRSLQMLTAAREETGAQVSVDHLPTVRGDATLLGQLFQNLVGNAIKFRSEQAPQVHLGAQAEEGHWLFHCADNGIGIEPRYAERIFTIFQRLHSKDRYPGTGIGLSLCKKIVEYHGGRIWVDTARSGGTTIFWTIPAITAEVGVEEAREATGP